MSRNYLLLVLLWGLFAEIATARSFMDCRVVTGGVTECNPYGARLHRVKKVVYDLDRQKLIIDKTLPVPKKIYVKVISVADMIEKYVKVEDSIRFKGSKPTPVTVTVVEEVIKKEFIKLPPKIELPPKPIIPEIVEGAYVVVSGDVLSKIAKKFGIKTKKLAKINGLKSKSTLRIGQKLKLPFNQEMINALAAAEYTVKDSDTLLSIAKKFNLDPKALVRFNSIKDATEIRTGKILKLPLPYVLAQIEKKKKQKLKRKTPRLDMRGFGKHKLRVTATAYSSHKGQTDSTPFLAAWNNRLRPGMKIIAVSRDMLTRYGMKNGTKVRIGGLRGYYRVRDKMNKRYRKRIDIYMGLDRRRALRWGRRSVVIYW